MIDIQRDDAPLFPIDPMVTVICLAIETYYRELLDDLRMHTTGERVRSEEMDQRHPGWLTGLSPADLPRFGDPRLIRTR